MAQDYQIAALWIGGALSFLEQLCLKSFVDAGHAIRLYAYEPIPNVPEGVEIKREGPCFGDCEGSCSVGGSPLTLTLALAALLLLRPRRARE